jgi:hypothetical protein
MQFWCRAVAMQMVEGRCRELRMARVVSAGCFPELCRLSRNPLGVQGTIGEARCLTAAHAVAIVCPPHVRTRSHCFGALDNHF